MTTIRKRPGRRGAVRALVAAVGAGVIALAVAPVSYASDQLRVQSASSVSEAPGFLQVTAESGPHRSTAAWYFWRALELPANALNGTRKISLP